jgi:hypothetical protein
MRSTSFYNQQELNVHKLDILSEPHLLKEETIFINNSGSPKS